MTGVRQTAMRHTRTGSNGCLCIPPSAKHCWVSLSVSQVQPSHPVSYPSTPRLACCLCVMWASSCHATHTKPFCQYTTHGLMNTATPLGTARKQCCPPYLLTPAGSSCCSSQPPPLPPCDVSGCAPPAVLSWLLPLLLPQSGAGWPAAAAGA